MKCTGRNCPMQYGTVDPSHCLADECPYLTKPLTNADCIRAMTDEELAKLFAQFETRCYERLEPLVKCETETFARQYLDWLQQEVDDG